MFTRICALFLASTLDLIRGKQPPCIYFYHMSLLCFYCSSYLYFLLPCVLYAFIAAYTFVMCE